MFQIKEVYLTFSGLILFFIGYLYLVIKFPLYTSLSLVFIFAFINFLYTYQKKKFIKKFEKSVILENECAINGNKEINFTVESSTSWYDGAFYDFIVAK